MICSALLCIPAHSISVTNAKSLTLEVWSTVRRTWVSKNRLLRKILYAERVNLRCMAPATPCVISTVRSISTGSAYFAALKLYTSAMEHIISAKDAMMSSLVSLIRAKFNCEIAKVQLIAP